MEVFDNKDIDLIYNITSIYSSISSVEEIILKEYKNNTLILYVKVKDNYINKLGYLMDKGITNEEELLIDNYINMFNKNNNKKLILSSNIYSQKHFGTFNNTYNNILPINEYTLYGKKKYKKKIK